MIEDMGREITCPKCGERGKVVFERVNVKGKPYYLSVRHTLGHGRSQEVFDKEAEGGRRCKTHGYKTIEGYKTPAERPVIAPKPLKGIEEVKKTIEDLKTSFLNFQRTIQEQMEGIVRMLRREAEGEEIVGMVTKHDERRGKVYVPKEWIGRKVRVSLLKEEESNIPEKPKLSELRIN